MATAELKEKTARLVSLIESENLAGILINSQPNFAWLTCGGSNAIDTSRENGAASILVTRDGKRSLLANNIEMPRMLKEVVSESDFDPVDFAWTDEKADPRLPLTLAESIAGGRVSVEAEFETQIAACRYELTDPEIERYRQLGRDAGAAMGRIAIEVSPGLLEHEIGERLRAELAASGITSVVTLIAADERIGHFRHPVPTAKRWERTLLLVTCARRDGLTASLSRMISAAEPSDDLKKRTAAAATVNAELLRATRVGATGADLYKAAAQAYTEQNSPDEIALHHQGGATGYRTRDWVAHPSSAERVRPQQAFAWNPSITGTKIEDTVLLIDGEIEVITSTPQFPVISNAIGEREFFSTGILQI